MNINQEFKQLIPPLTTEELEALEKSLLTEGCRDAIITWQDTIIDGHNRYEICTKHKLSYKTESKEFDSELDVKIWMVNNQFGRRNLQDFVKGELMKTLEDFEKEKGERAYKEKAVFKGNQHSAPLSLNDNEPKHNTREIIAEKLGWSTGKKAKFDVVTKKAPEEVKQKLRTGEVSINQVYQDIKSVEKKEKRQQEIEKQKQDIAEGKVKLPEGVFEVIVMDPPWAYGREYDPKTSRVANPYPEMTQDQLKQLNPPFAENCVLFLWTTHQFIFDAKELLDYWGFTYKATGVWDKERIGMGSWLRMQCEFFLIGIKGKPGWENTIWRDIIREPRREHSRKPETFYQMVDEITIGRKLDYFSRSNRQGWEAMGNDINKF